MTRPTTIAVLLILLCLVLGIAGTGNLVFSSEAMAAAKTEYPTKPISMVVPFQAGGGTDVVGRMIEIRAHHTDF